LKSQGLCVIFPLMLHKCLILTTVLFFCFSSPVFAATKPDTTPPSGTVVINTKTKYTNSLSVSLTLSAKDKASGVTQMQFSNDNSSWSSAETYSTTKTWSLSSGDGKKTVYAKFKDTPGNWSKAVSDTIILDTTGPSTPVVTDDGINTAVTTKLNAKWTSTDSGSGIAEYQYKITQDSTSGPTIVDWTSTKTSKSVKKSGLSLTDGKIYYFQVKAKDDAGNWSGIGSSDGITVGSGDKIAPTGTIVIDKAALKTNTLQVTLTLTATDKGTGVTQMQLSNDSTNWSGLGPFAKTKAWALNSGDGTKTVYVKFKDAAGNLSTSYSDTITLDTTAPTISNVKSSNITATTALIEWQTNEASTSEVGYGLTASYGKSAGVNKKLVTAHSDTITGLKENTLYHYRVISTDDVANVAASGDYTFTTTINDTKAPTGTIKINNDAASTSTTQVTLTLSATDDKSGMNQMQFSNDNKTWSTPEAYSTTKTWTLTTGNGKKTVYVKFSDKLNNWSSAYSDTINLVTAQAPAAPVINTVTTPTNKNSQTISGTKTADATEIIITCANITIGQVNLASSTTWNCALSNLKEGNNAISVKAKNAAGLESTSVTTAIVLDTQAPVITILSPKEGEVVK